MNNNIDVAEDIQKIRDAHRHFTRWLRSSIAQVVGVASNTQGIEVVTSGEELLQRGLIHPSWANKLEQHYSQGEQGFAEATGTLQSATSELRDQLGAARIRIVMGYRMHDKNNIGNCILIEFVAGEYPVAHRTSLQDLEKLSSYRYDMRGNPIE